MKASRTIRIFGTYWCHNDHTPTQHPNKESPVWTLPQQYVLLLPLLPRHLWVFKSVPKMELLAEKKCTIVICVIAIAFSTSFPTISTQINYIVDNIILSLVIEHQDLTCDNWKIDTIIETWYDTLSGTCGPKSFH